MIEKNELTSRAEEYLEAVLNMRVEGNTVLAARLAERLSVSPPTVTGALSRLKKDGLLTINSRREIELTGRGEQEARKIIRRHRLLELLLTRVLGVDWSECHEEACRLEHAVSPLVESKLEEHMGRPKVCPHGNPIPYDGDIVLPEGALLSSVKEGTGVEVVRISEESTLQRELMRFFQKQEIFPGRSFLVKQVAPYGGTITLQGKSGDVTIGMKAASSIWVKPSTS